MKLFALSHYDSDFDTRFGDCILLVDPPSLTVYDCGHARHKEYIQSYLENHHAIDTVHVVISHNDSDHTNGVCELLRWLKHKKMYTVAVYTHQYLKHTDTILDKIDDGRRNRESLKESLLSEFDNIKEIIETAQELGFDTVEAIRGTGWGNCEVAGPTSEEFTEVAAKAVDNRQNDTIGEGHAEETVMNAASVQLKVSFANGKKALLCGDASPDYLKDLESYSLIQLPHHGQKDDAIAIFEKLGGEAYRKEYLISDNTGSAPSSGGSEKLVEYMKEEQYTPARNTKNGIVEFPDSTSSSKTTQGRRFLGDLDSN